MNYKQYDTIRAHFLEVGDLIGHDGVVYTVLDIAEDEYGYRITGRDTDWDEVHEFILEDEQIVALMIRD